MKNNVVSFKDLYQIIGEFRAENNERFDKIESMFNKHLEWGEEMVKEYSSDYEKRITSLEKLADKALFFILIVSGIIAATWQIVVGWIKRELKI